MNRYVINAKTKQILRVCENEMQSVFALSACQKSRDNKKSRVKLAIVKSTKSRITKEYLRPDEISETIFIEK